jgi:TRAP-type C4-dicarboxylate transport system substrate-binding protein
MQNTPPIAESLWKQLSEEAQTAILKVIANKDRWIATLMSALNDEEPYSFRFGQVEPIDLVRCITQSVYDTTGKKLVDENFLNVVDELKNGAGEKDDNADKPDMNYPDPEDNRR